ncbi:aspartyl/asparaginyl beta-hydroxylase domain-containing protein [Tundrisphaera sp. TA3]|uniref:aspartyl/asparaginyl beta-hydroxylase domain-containing protein n=1 Tax=Tundrisphaera sp. TA3 TaxID=3435775 RepID=UPI003EB87939
MGLLDRIDYESLLVPLNKFFDLHTGGKRRPVFFDVDKTCPQFRELDRNFPAIRDEVMRILPRKSTLPRYHDLDAAQYGISAQGDPERSWKVFFLYAMGEKPPENVALCPKTSALLDGIPGLFQAFFSILEAGKSIPAHEGPYRGYLRYHLGLVVPEQSPPSIRIKDQHYTWKEGESMMFDDSWDHEVINHCEQDRVILIADIRRPMPFPFDPANRIAQSIMRQVYGKEILKKLA